MGPDDAADVFAAPSRRAFIAGAIALATAALAEAGPLARRAAALPAGDLFPLGVASGDPTDDGVVLWTRLLAPGGDPLPVTDVPVDWEVATDAGFASVVASGTAPAVAALAHSVHVEVDGLASDSWFFYRFHADGRTSPVGRTRTFPGSGVMPSQVRFALASCQNFNVGYYTAHAAIAAVADLDLVVFVGDYVYEGGGNSGVRPFVLPTATNVPTYRARYEHYKRDLNLQASHQRAPWVITMDDHEVANNVVGDLGPDGSRPGTRPASPRTASVGPTPSRSGTSTSRSASRRPAVPTTSCTAWSSTRTCCASSCSTGGSTAAPTPPATPRAWPSTSRPATPTPRRCSGWTRRPGSTASWRHRRTVERPGPADGDGGDAGPGRPEHVFNYDQWDGYRPPAAGSSRR